MRREESKSGCSISSDEEAFHVVAVDDSRMQLKLVEKLLRRCELTIRVTTLNSPQEALQYLMDNNNDEKVDMLISDYSMPLMTGYELLTEMKGCCALKDIPVVIMSSENVVSRIHNCMERGAEDFLIKPLNTSKLVSLTSTILKRGPASAHFNSNGTSPLRRKSMVAKDGTFAMSSSSYKKHRPEERIMA